MGRPRKTLKEEFDVPTAEDIQNEAEYQSFIADLGQMGLTVTINRFPKVGKDMEWVDDVSIDQAPLAILREKYGPGKYRLTFKNPNGSYFGQKTVVIASPYTPNGNGNGNGGLHDDFQKTLMLTLISNLKPAPPFDIGPLLAGMGAMMTALRPQTPEAPKQVDPLQMFQSILTMYQTIKPKEDKSELEKLRETAAVIKEFAGDSGGSNSMWDAVASVGKDVVDKLAPVITGLATGAKMPAPNGGMAPARPASAAQAVNGGALPSAGGSTPPAQPDANENLRQWLATQIAFFKQKALAGKDSGFWVDYVFENNEEPGCQAIMYAIRQGATFEHLIAFDAEIGQNPVLSSWFREVFDGVRSGLSGDVDSVGRGGDEGDHSTDGGIGTSRRDEPGYTHPGVPVS